MIWTKRLDFEVTATEERDNRGQPYFQITVQTDTANAVNFESQMVTAFGPSFRISANDLQLGANWIYFTVSRKGHESRDSVLINNSYTPLTISLNYGHDSLGRITHASVTTEPGTRMRACGIDSVLERGMFEFLFSPDSVLEANNPDRTPTVLIINPVVLDNPSGNTLRDTIRVAYSYPRVSLTVTDPWNCYISRTGRSYTIRGNATSRALIRVFDGPNTWCSSLGQVRAGRDGSFSKYVSVDQFGENIFTLVAGVEGMTSDTVNVTIYREMTDSERRTAYQESCERVTAKYLADHHSQYIGRRVRVWGRTVEWLGSDQLHCYAGDGHFIADLSGFDRVPALQGLSFTVWGEVTSRSQDFYTQAGSYVHAPVITGVYTTTGY